MGRFVIVAYTPKPGCAEQLVNLVRKHVQILRAQKLVTDRQPYAMQAQDGTIVEVFEWTSAAAIEAAHTNPAVHALWAEFGEVCEYRPLANLAECSRMFAEFDAVDL
jgi:quinol monooxygenase YgiN